MDGPRSIAMIERGLAGAGKLLIASLFWWSGIFGIVVTWPDTVGFVAARGIPLPMLAAAGAGLFEVLVPLGLFHRRSERWATLALAVYCLATALLFHDWWDYSGGARAAQTVNFMKNLALAGALLVLASRRIDAA